MDHGFWILNSDATSAAAQLAVADDDDERQCESVCMHSGGWRIVFNTTCTQSNTPTNNNIMQKKGTKRNENEQARARRIKRRGERRATEME